jgi:hypothetical protein
MKQLSLLAILFAAASVSAIEPVTNNLALPLPAAPQIIIPAAGNVQGDRNTHFRSEITVLNYANREQLIRFRWIPQGGGAGSTSEVILPARTGMSSNDFVAEVLGVTGLGSIIVEGILPGGSVDAGAQLYATSRIWTPQPLAGSGTNSQSFLAVPLSYANTTRTALIGLRRDANYRLNVGIVNLHPTEAQTFRITAAGSNPTIAPDITTLTVPANGMQQINLPGVPQPNLQVLIENITGAGTRSNVWIAYGSSVDNVTGDSWSMIGFTPPPGP